MTEVADIRYEIFDGRMDAHVTGILVAEGPGVLSGINRARSEMEALGLTFQSDLVDGDQVSEAQEIARVIGNPFQISQAEERIIGTLSKSSGIATAARQFRVRIGKGCKVVCGGWKKVPPEIKNIVRKACRDGSIEMRMFEKPFVYLDKNYVRILGGIRLAVQKVLPLERSIVVQIRGETKSLEEEAVEAVQAGAEVVMVDTGGREDAAGVIRVLEDKGLRSRVEIAFAGNITLDETEHLSQMDLDILDIGYAIVDAPCIPMKFDVIEVK